MKRVNKRLVLGLLVFLPIGLRANTVTFTNTTNKEIVVVPTGKDPRKKEIVALVPAHSLSLRFKLPNLRNVQFYVKQGSQ